MASGGGCGGVGIDFGVTSSGIGTLILVGGAVHWTFAVAVILVHGGNVCMCMRVTERYVAYMSKKE